MKSLICLISALILLLAACGEKTATENTGTIRRAAVETREIPEKDDAPQPPADTVIAQTQTPLLDDSPSRVENINIACGAINGTVLYPGGSFSFNDTVGRRTEANGYGDAPVLVNGHKEEGCGGGVCQVSSTLYMAAVQAGLQIDERHPHSHSVGYTPDGMDATVVFGEKDLAFTNNTGKIVTLGIWTDGVNVFSQITAKG